VGIGGGSEGFIIVQRQTTDVDVDVDVDRAILKRANRWAGAARRHLVVALEVAVDRVLEH